MNSNDFRCMLRGKQLSILNLEAIASTAPIERRTQKKDRALLMLHGFSSTPAVFRRLVSHLSAHYDGLFCPTLVGHGADLPTFAQTKAADWLDQTLEYGTRLSQEFKQLDVLGLSLGGVLACHLSQNIALNHLYLMAPALDVYLNCKRSIFTAKCLHKLGFRYLRAAAGDLYTSDHCEIAYRQLPLTTIIEILSLVEQFQFSVPNCPTDVFLGSHDKVVSSDRLAKRFANQAQIQTHWLAHSAHVLPLDGDVDYMLSVFKRSFHV